MHGIFEQQQACDAILAWAGLSDIETPDFAAIREEGINRVADAVEQYLDLKKLGLITE
ncbi:hypothetical protein ACN08N_20720 [Photobacterium leiognathi subsp. mandapamensis]|uniref:hypothetical protein n=1 Tax=Photobacterium leiognathi TaxID=553611 RepID=UPI003AF3998D